MHNRSPPSDRRPCASRLVAPTLTHSKPGASRRGSRWLLAESKPGRPDCSLAICRSALPCQNRAMVEPPGLQSDRLAVGARAEPSQTRHRTRQRVLVIAILVVAGLFDAISGNPVDAILLVAVGVLMAVFPDAPAATEAAVSGPRWRVGSIATVLALATAFALVVGAFERYTWPVTIGVLVPGITGLVFAWRGTRRRDPGPTLSLPQVLPWMAVFVTVGLFELTNLLLQPGLTIDSYDHPTLSVLSDAVLNGHFGRSLGLFLWLLLGAYLLDR